jgi:hypothetical protein
MEQSACRRKRLAPVPLDPAWGEAASETPPDEPVVLHGWLDMSPDAPDLPGCIEPDAMKI